MSSENDEPVANGADVALSVAVAVAGFKTKEDFMGSDDLQGGEKINMKIASELKAKCWGSATMPPRPYWLKQGITLNKPDELFAFGVKTSSNGTQNILMCIQAYFLKHLFFESKKPKGKERPTNNRRYGKNVAETKHTRVGSLKTNQILRPNADKQNEMFVGGLAEILSRAADGGPIYVCMLGRETCFESETSYGVDGFTEKMYLFKCKKVDEVKPIIRRFMIQFQQPNGIGLLCFLYSLVLSRNIQRIREDMQNEAGAELIDGRGDASPAAMHLVLFGRASPYLHNGAMEIRDENGEVHSREGIVDRSQIGYLLWDKDELTTKQFNIGSRLKTPTLPLWATKCNDIVGVLFNPNIELLKSHDAEKRFNLYYYSVHEFKEIPVKETKLTIEIMKKVQNLADLDIDDDVLEPPLESLIRTKWEGSTIHWNGNAPYY